MYCYPFGRDVIDPNTKKTSTVRNRKGGNGEADDFGSFFGRNVCRGKRRDNIAHIQVGRVLVSLSSADCRLRR